MTKFRGFIYFVIFLLLLLLLRSFVNRAFPALPKDSEIWFASGLLIIILGIFITEKYFTKPLDVIVNVVTLLIVLWTVDSSKTFSLYPVLIVFTFVIGLIALISFLVADQKKDSNSWPQRLSKGAYLISTFFGSAKILFSIVFVLSLFNYFVFSLRNQQSISQQQIAILGLIVFWVAAILVEPIDRRVIRPIMEIFKSKDGPRFIGRIKKRLSPNILVVERNPASPQLSFGDIAVVASLNRGSGEAVVMLVDVLDAEDTEYFLFYVIKGSREDINEDVYLFIPTQKVKEQLEIELQSVKIYQSRLNLIGTVYSNSDIDVIKIRMIAGVDEQKKLEEGDLLQVEFYKESTKYQIINVETANESVDGESRKGIKIITAQQIGCWNSENHKFSNANWVPDLNSLVFLERQDAADISELTDGCYRVGLIPKSKYPIYLDFEEAVSHHIAIIGKTGTGKSYMAAKIIEKLSMNNYKVVVLEIDQKSAQSLSKYINEDLISSKQAIWSSTQKRKTVSGRSVEYEEWKAEIDFSGSDGKRIFVINWENRSLMREDGPLSQTDGAIAVINSVIQYQTAHPDEKICVAMEEAYDFIPEHTFGQQDFGQPGVSRVSQLVLKCRKHNIGFLIITQRTALVTKTILYQCHSIIALQSFDETSKTFMGAYINSRYLDSMSILPKFRAIVVGKGSSCDKPVIVDFTDKSLLPGAGISRP